MRGAKQFERDAKCPYIQYVSREEIYCESPLLGMDDADCGCRLHFNKREQLSAHYLNYCCKNWRRCEIAQAINRKYEDDDDQDHL